MSRHYSKAKGDSETKKHSHEIMLKALQKQNLELAKCNAGLTVQIAQLQDCLLKSMEDKIHEQEERIKVERQLMEAMSALDVLKVEVGKRVPLLKAVAEHLLDTAGLFDTLLELDYGEILIERIALNNSSLCKKGNIKARRIELAPIQEREEINQI